MDERYQVLKAIADSEAEIAHLEQASARALFVLKELHFKLAMIEKAASVTATGFSKYSPTAAKVQLFADLFRGRDDIFARYWFSQKSGKKGYSPVCEYEWQPGVCTKPEKKCTAYKYVPLTHVALRSAD